MDFEIAKDFLEGCRRTELRDHAFGNMEVTWTFEGQLVGGGYFSGIRSEVWIDTELTGKVTFEGDEAQELHSCGTLGRVERNDTTGPETYSEGTTMPGLTTDGVLDELTKGE